MIPELGLLDWLSLCWFAVCWMGYNYFSRYWSRRSSRLQNSVHAYIKDWIRVMHHRDLRIVDTTIVSNIERNAMFFASSSLLIIAGLLTAAGSTDKVINFIAVLPFVAEVTREAWEIKILLLVLIYAYAFFTFSWCVRQWGFASVLIGSAPLAEDESATKEYRRAHGHTLAEVIWLAIYSFNLGLRAYYFSLAMLSWFLHPVAFVIVTTWVVAVIYRREFRSRTLRALMAGQDQLGATRAGSGPAKSDG